MDVTVYTASWCHDWHALKKFLDAHGVAYRAIDVDADAEASAEVIRHVGKRAIPQLVIDGEWFQPYEMGRGLLEDELRRRLGISRMSRFLRFSAFAGKAKTPRGSGGGIPRG